MIFKSFDTSMFAFGQTRSHHLQTGEVHTHIPLVHWDSTENPPFVEILLEKDNIHVRLLDEDEEE